MCSLPLTDRAVAIDADKTCALRELVADTFVLASAVGDLHVILGRKFPLNVRFDGGKNGFLP